MLRATLYLTLGLATLLTGHTLTRRGWFAPRPSVAPRQVTDADAADAAKHLRQGAPQHWRTCLLQR